MVLFFHLALLQPMSRIESKGSLHRTIKISRRFNIKKKHRLLKIHSLYQGVLSLLCQTSQGYECQLHLLIRVRIKV